ncbi:MAG: hypothetical protein E6I91_18710 [Chloroflexi bacterium]|nr:MAG: hypothetical protein E6I91_18710 [Chloroflexota bacterium]
MLKEQKVSRVIKQTIFAAIVVTIAISFAACGTKGTTGATGGGSNPGGASDVAATVNSKNIMLSEVDRLIGQQFQGGQNNLSPLELAQTRLQALDTLIQKEVLFQRAEKEGLLPKDDEVTTFITDIKQQSGMTEFVNPRGVGLASIVVDPADNGAQDDAKNDAEAKAKIDNIYAQLKSGADFASVARARSEDASNVHGGDLGFATEDDLRRNGFPQQLIDQLFGPMQVGSFTSPIQFPNKRWYIFKLQSKQLQTENLTFDSPGVRQQIIQALTDQRKNILNAALLEVAMSEAKIVNNLAADMLAKPELMSGMRPATPGASTTPSTSPAASPSASVAASPQATASPKATATPKK